MSSLESIARPRVAGGALFGAVLVFAAVCGAAQAWRADLDPLRMPLSAYLAGVGGAWVRGAYYLLAIALAWFGASGGMAASRQRRSALAAVLFVVAGIALAAVALSYSVPRTPWLEFVHGLSANTAFLCVGVGMLLQSLHWRRETADRFTHGLLALAAIGFAALWLPMLWHGLPRGATQKGTIGLILLWNALAGWRLLHRGSHATA